MTVLLIDRREVREEAKRLMGSAQVPVFRITALFLAIDLLLSEISTAVSWFLDDSIGIASLSFSFAGILVSLLSTVLLAGYACYCLGVQRGECMPYASLFSAFPFAGSVVLLMVLQGILIALGLMLFVVPGCVLAFSYAISLYYLCEDPDIGAIGALRRSREQMKGYKMQLFALILSFFPLLLLFAVPVSLCEYFLRGAFPETLGGELLDTLVSGLLSGCASLYLTPYMALAQVSFFRRVMAAGEPEEPNDPF